jgi:hypothetical protein
MVEACLALALACTPLSPEDVRWQVGYTALHLLDWAQSRRIAANPAWEERNPLLGKRPPAARLSRYMAGTLVAHWTVVTVLPMRLRRPFQLVTVGIEAGTVAANWRLGVRLDF